MSGQVPTIEICDSTSHGGGASPVNAPFSIGQDLAQLIAKGSVACQASGARIIKLDAGILAAASPYQIGVVAQGVTCTEAMVAANQALLDELGKYARENGYSIRIEARLALTPAGNWNYLWLGPAVAAGLPVDAVENDDEIAWTHSGARGGYGEAAQNMVLSMQQITKYYPKVQLGQWEAQSPISNTVEWLAAYNKAADAAGMPRMSYFVADGAQSPWVTPTSTWAAWMTDLSHLARQNGMGLTAFVGGTDVSGSNERWTAGAEQYAAQLAQLPGVEVDTLLIRTWGYAFPDAILPINKPTTLANVATEIAATYNLYDKGKINAAGPVMVAAVPQIVATVGAATNVGPISLNWAGAASTDRIAVVVLDTIGRFTATAVRSGTVEGIGTNKLILNGTLADVAAELKTLKVTQPVAGLDSIDIEVFGTNGRLADHQIAVLSVAGITTNQDSMFEFLPVHSGQDWASAAAASNAGGFVTSMHFNWNPTNVDPITGEYRIIRSASVHEPLAQDGLVLASGRLEQSATNQTLAGPGSLALNSGFACGAFYSPANFSTVNILTTDMYFEPANGKLRTVVDQFAATEPTAMAPGPKLPNYFLTGGWQTTQFNTGSNPDWQSTWSASLASVTTVYGSFGKVLEMTFVGGVKRPGFVLDNVFNPYTGALWEQFETLPPPSLYANSSSGTQLVTEFNTGDNPNWNYGSWGANAHVTITWQDYYPVSVSATSPPNLSLYLTEAYGTTGTKLSKGTAGGGNTLIGGNGSTTINGVGHDIIYAAAGHTTITTGAGGSTIYLSRWAGSDATLDSGGGDLVDAGASRLAISNTGTIALAIKALGNEILVHARSRVNITGDYNNISADRETDIVVMGVHNDLTLNDPDANVEMGDYSSVTVKGNNSTVDVANFCTILASGRNNTLNLNGTADVTQAGDFNTVNMYGSAGTVTIGSDATSWCSGSNNTVTAGDRMKTWIFGSGNILRSGNDVQFAFGAVSVSNEMTARSGVLGWDSGTGNSISILSNSFVCQFGSNGTVVAGDGFHGWEAGTGNKMTAGSYSTITIVGNYNAASLGNGSTIGLNGIEDTARAGDFEIANMYSLVGTARDDSGAASWFWRINNPLSPGDWLETRLAGSRNILHAGSNETIGKGGAQAWDYGTGNTISILSNSFVCQFGSNGTVVAGDGFHGWEAGTGNKMTAGSHSTITIVGSHNVAFLGDDCTINLEGNDNLAVIGDDAMVFISGNNATVAISSDTGEQDISGFDIERGDRLNLSGLRGQVDLRNDLSNLSDFVGVAHTGADTILTISGAGVMDTVTLHGVGSLNLVQLIAHGALSVGPEVLGAI